MKCGEQATVYMQRGDELLPRTKVWKGRRKRNDC